MEFVDSIMSKLRELLVITDGSGKPIMLFGGRISLSQFLLFCAVLLFALSLIKFCKGLFKFAAVVVVVLGLCINFGLFSVDEVKGVAGKVAEVGVDTFEQIASTSENVRVQDKTVEIRLDGEWHDITDIETFEIATGKVVIWMNGVRYDVEDSSIVAALEALM